MPRIVNIEGANPSVAYTINVTTNPEVPGPPFAVGTIGIGENGEQWLFCKLAASQTIAAGNAVYVSDHANFVITSLANAAKALRGAFVGIAGAAATSGATSYEYIWIQRAGYLASANCLTGSLANTVLHTTATTGRLDDTAVGGTSATVDGIVQLATAASNVAPVILNFPVIGVAD